MTVKRGFHGARVGVRRQSGQPTRCTRGFAIKKMDPGRGGPKTSLLRVAPGGPTKVSPGETIVVAGQGIRDRFVSAVSARFVHRTPRVPGLVAETFNFAVLS